MLSRIVQFVLFLLPLALSACVREVVALPPDAVVQATNPPASFKPPAKAPEPTNTPIVTYWENGNFTEGRSPRALFALFPDGTVVRNLDGRLYQGKITMAQASQVAQSLIAAGVMQTPLSTGAVYPNGPSQLLSLNLNGQQITLTNDSDYAAQDLDQIALSGSEARQQLETFIEIWGRSISTLREVWPTKLEQATFVPGLIYPAIRR